MGIRDLFRKKGEVIDLGNLQKKGIFEFKEEREIETRVFENKKPDSQASGGFDFFSSIAENAGSNSGSSSSYREESKINDKIKSLSVRFSKLMDRVELLERKIERLERGRE